MMAREDRTSNWMSRPRVRAGDAEPRTDRYSVRPLLLPLDCPPARVSVCAIGVLFAS